jgi:hypothetical protein
MSCEHDCVEPPVFPKPIWNRPGLERIDYRIGTYAELRGHLLDALDKAPALAAWTHRGTDDPGIALLEGAAIVGDVLTFYQSLYANEAYLRTAQWRESVIDLVRLLGYRLAPGVGGEAVFALALRNNAKPVTVPKGFGLKAQVGADTKPAEFETSEALLAYPHLGQFHLYRPRLAATNITAGQRQLEIQAVDGAIDAASIGALKIKAGDRIMLVPNGAMFDTSTAYTAQELAEIIIVDRVDTVLDRTIISFKGSLRGDHGTSITAYPIKRTFGHFGHGAPAFVTAFDNTSHDVTLTATDFQRATWIGNVSTPNFYSGFAVDELPLDQKVDDLAAGGKLICQGLLSFFDFSVTMPAPFTVVREIKALRADTLTWGNLNGASTIATADKPLIANSNLAFHAFDLRKVQFHEVDGPALTLRAVTTWDAGAFIDTGLAFFGTYAEASALLGRSVLFVHEDGTAQPVTVTSPPAGLSLTGKDEIHPWVWGINLDKLPAFPREDFDEAAPKVTVYGNVLPATQGKTVSETPIGSGDARQIFQTFPVPKTPLTYLLDETQTPAQTPELKIYVEGTLWRKIETFFGAAPDDPVYIVREDAGGASFVQFGDGKTGARLPSGKDNVSAVFRVGSGAYGALKADTSPQATGKLTGLDKLYLPQPATTGAGPESENNAREAAPGRVQSLGRLVSLADFEAETLALPNVLKANAAWAAPEGVPLVQLTVLTQSQSDQDLTKVREALASYNRYRGPARFPIQVDKGRRYYIYVKLAIGFDPARREQDVKAAVQRALGMYGAEADGIDGERGLFGLHGRRFGQSAHTSQIVGAAQQADGVVWVTLAAAQLLPLAAQPANDPLTLAVPAYDSVPAATLACGNVFILALHKKHLVLQMASAS